MIKKLLLAAVLTLATAVGLSGCSNADAYSSSTPVTNVFDIGTTDLTIAPSLERVGSGTAYTFDFTNSYAKGVRVFLDITAETGTATLDVKLQSLDPVSATYFDIPGASLDQKSATSGDDTLILYPGIAETANESVSDVLPLNWRAVATVGTGASSSFTFSLGGTYLH